MHERTVRALFQKLLLVSAVGPLAACGGHVAGAENGSDAAHDAPTDSIVGDVIVPLPDVPMRDAPPETSTGCGATTRPDPIPPCGYQVTIVGDPASCGFGDSGVGDPELCHRLCQSTTISYCQLGMFGGPTSVECGGPCEGRRPQGLAALRLDAEGEAIGRYFARSSYLEAASVDAFRILRDELRHHRAPTRLVRGCGRAARDEVRHARATAALARRHRARPTKPSIARRPVRSLEAIAIENAIEGCVRETFGAMIATVQGDEARDPVVRAAMKRIARDETQHAALSWQLGAWLETRLDRGARERVRAAKQEAIATLREETRARTQSALAPSLGLPTPSRSIAMLDGLAQTLWG